MGKINRKKKKDVIHVFVRPTSEKNISKKSFGTISEQNTSSINNNSKSNNRSINRVIPSFQSSNIFGKEKDSIGTNVKSKKKKYCGLSLCTLLLLVYFLFALLAAISAIVVGILTANKGQSSSTSTSIVTSTTTSVSTTSTTSITSTTSSTTSTATTTSTTTSITTSTTTVTTTSTTTTTTTTYYTCSNFTVKANWDYSGNDLISNGPTTFASCCAWCLNVTACVAFTFNPWSSCLLKNSPGAGGNSYPNSIGAAR